MMRDSYQAEACRARALEPHVEGLTAEKRAYAAYAAARDHGLQQQVARRIVELLAGRRDGEGPRSWEQWVARRIAGLLARTWRLLARRA